MRHLSKRDGGVCHVTINTDALHQHTNTLASNVWQQLENMNEFSSSRSMANAVSDDGFIESLFIEWDNEKVHYSEAEHEPELSAQYILVLSALNFCFWPLEGFEYSDLASGLRDVLLRDRNAFDADRLMQVDEGTLCKWLRNDNIPMVTERARLVREIGFGLYGIFDGKASNLIRAAQKSASQLVRLVTQHFPGFRDMYIDPGTGEQIYLLKRAQIFVADVYGCFGGKGLGEFTDMQKLTMFADYRVPQILREYGILTYDDELSRLVDQSIMIPAGSQMEIDIRAATIQSVEMIRTELSNKHRIRVKSLEIDWLLWQQGEELVKLGANKIGQHHRTLTIFY